jgi:predicted permease
VFALAIIVTTLATLVFALVPAGAARRIEPARDLQAESHVERASSLISIRPSRIANLVATTEVGAAVILLVGAGLLVRTVVNLVRLDLGFRTDRLLSVSVAPMLRGGEPPKTRELAELIRSRILDVPGVTSVTWSGQPILAQQWGATGLILGDDENTRVEMVDWLGVGPSFFETLDMRLVAGRPIEAADCREGTRMVWVNQRFVDLYVRNREALGAPVRVSSGIGRYQIAGVARDSRYARLRDDVRPTVFVPSASGARQFIVRSAFDPSELAGRVVSAIGQVSSSLLVYDVKDVRTNLQGQISEERLLAQVTLAFGGLAVVLSAVGVYGVVSASVARRTSELAVRISLGATRSNVLALIMKQGAQVAVLGSALGLVGASWLSKLLGTVLFGVGPFDGVTYAAATAIVVGIVALASFIPAWRATRVDPIAALRGDF